MSQQQDAIYANDRIDLILPYGKIDEEFYQQIIAPYEPTRDQRSVCSDPYTDSAE